jgi:hypothetical protein
MKWRQVLGIVKTSRITKARLKSSEAPAEAFWRSPCSVGLLTAHKLPRQLRLVEPEPTRPPSRPAETGAAHPGLKTVLRRLLTAAPAALAAHFFGRRVQVRAAQAARPAPSAPPDQGASGAGACAAPTRPSYRRAPADPALALAAGKRAVRAPAAVRPLGAHGAGAAGAARRPAAAAPPGRPPTGAAGALPAAVRAGRGRPRPRAGSVRTHGRSDGGSNQAQRGRGQLCGAARHRGRQAAP